MLIIRRFLRVDDDCGNHAWENNLGHNVGDDRCVVPAISDEAVVYTCAGHDATISRLGNLESHVDRGEGLEVGQGSPIEERVDSWSGLHEPVGTWR